MLAPAAADNLSASCDMGTVKVSDRTMTGTCHVVLGSLADQSRLNTLYEYEEAAVCYDSVEDLEWNEILKDTKFLDHGDETRWSAHAEQPLSTEDLAILPSRVYVHVLRMRHFITADIQNLKETPTLDNPFEFLKISPSHQVMLRSIVSDHLKKKTLAGGREVMDQDIIRGKGKGVVILLYGTPGVGKIATAEVIAQASKKPLFPITCGDLGTDPATVEKNLLQIFRLANLWDCMHLAIG